MAKDGGPAFPGEQNQLADGTWNQTYDPGMTLRDWFAGQGLVGIMANLPRPDQSIQADQWAKCAYELADAMLKERSND